MADVKVGKITHHYDKIGVAVIEVAKPLKVGDTIKISGHDKEFTQTISSMQIEHEQIQEAKKGQVIGLKVDQPVKENDEVFLVV
ncbi:U32 family peptidase C-terminal domain-containing protein [Candidatus Gottesmanbacteria bacterium]|nr:U32 family peptidase C-terminal domain-containing protein [Candidatus Gottesmanbacteria bacterium]MBI5465138.1 U32 family peptidase C-terminal domain-containing protein [Candidatus Gottesmanbacteria bacterium]